jgi:hypothetical protein
MAGRQFARRGHSRPLLGTTTRISAGVESPIDW